MKLVHTEAERLGVPRENVITAGTSLGAILALATGLSAGVGRIVAGAAPVRMGRQLVRLDDIAGPTSKAKGASAQFLALGDNGDGREVEWFDGFLFGLAEDVRERVVVELFVSGTDETHAAMRELADALESNPLVESRLTLGGYGSHGEVSAPFTDFSLEVLTAVCGRR